MRKGDRKERIQDIQEGLREEGSEWDGSGGKDREE